MGICNVRPLPEIHLSGLSGLEGELDRGFDLYALEGFQITAHTGVGAGKAVIPDQGVIDGSALDSFIEPFSCASFGMAFAVNKAIYTRKLLKSGLNKPFFDELFHILDSRIS